MKGACLNLAGPNIKKRRRRLVLRQATGYFGKYDGVHNVLPNNSGQVLRKIASKGGKRLLKQDIFIVFTVRLEPSRRGCIFGNSEHSFVESEAAIDVANWVPP